MKSAIYRGKYILQGLDKITPEMEVDLDKAYEICIGYKNEIPCELCGRCCHQPHIVVLPQEVDKISTATGINLFEFMTEYVTQTSDGRLLFKKTDPCAFLGSDNKCTIWKNRPEICDEFPFVVSMFMSRVYLAITNHKADILELVSYMDDTWPCTRAIKNTIVQKVEEARKQHVQSL